MKRTALILVILFSSVIFSSQLSSDVYKNKDSSELVEQFVSVITSILQGKDYSEFSENISPEAYVIYNNTYESIFEVLGNPSKKEIFIEGIDAKVGFLYLWMPDNEKNGYMVFETKSADDTKISWHSILFKVGKNQKWQILSWHKS